MLDVKLLKNTVSKRKKDFIEFLQDLISIPGFSGKERDVILRVKKEMEKLGYDEIIKSRTGSIAGLIGSGSKKILYDAHVDTVRVADRSAWTVDPFGAICKDGKIYGLGACDTKASVASMIYGGAIIKDLGLLDDFTLFVLAGVLEEDFEGEANRYIFENKELGVIPDFAVIGEPSSLRIARGNKGRVEIKITVKGKSAHGSTPHLGENALYKMAPLLMELEKLNERLPVDRVMGNGTLAVTSMEIKSSSRNAIPGECSIFLDRRILPGETCDDILNSIKNLTHINDGKVEVVTEYVKAYTGLEFQKEKFFPSWLFPFDHPLLFSACKTWETLFSVKPEVFTWDFCTNGNYIAGEAKIPSIGFGPGDPSLAHTADEYVSVEEVEKAVCFYAAFPKIMCKSL